VSVNDHEEAVELSALKADTEEVVERAAATHRSVHLTRQGQVVAVLRAIEDHQEVEEERAFLRAVVEGLADLEAGREVSLEKARAAPRLATRLAAGGPSLAGYVRGALGVSGGPSPRARLAAG
jgi:prevent-host-death family protein